MFVVCAGLAASNSVRTSRVLPEHSRGTTSCEDTWYCSADHRSYLGKHERRQQKHIREHCGKLARMLSFYFVTGRCDGAPCAFCLCPHRHVLKWSVSFCEESSVCQRDRETRLAVAGVLTGTAIECGVPRVGRSPRWGRLSGIAPSLLLNAVVVVDGKLLMGERECACRRVVSHGGNSLELCMCVCLTDVVLWNFISRYSVAQQ
ncbi:trans-sialidase [Trypanosoma cruzi]|nr:trans-sialidase [Trypanosoma cruzi]